MSETACGRQHGATEPNLEQDAPTAELPAREEYDDGDIKNLWLSGTRIVGLDLDRPEFLDVRLEDCDLSGIVATGYVARRVHLHRTRIRGVTLAKGQYDDGFFEGCTTDELSFRFSRLRRVIFRDCDLSGIDFYSTTFDHVTIDSCGLQRGHFDAAVANCLAITNCDLTGVSGVSGLKGAQLDGSDLPAMSIALATELGIAVRDG